MITCPNCNHQNPDGALQCEACYTPLPAMVTCPSCGTPVQKNASFCGQCGNDLRDLSSSVSPEVPENIPASDMPEAPIATSSTEVSAFPESASPIQNVFAESEGSNETPAIPSSPASSSPESSSPESSSPESSSPVPGSVDFDFPDLVAPDPSLTPDPISAASSEPAPPVTTQLQVVTARLRHAQTDTPIEIPNQLSVVRIGKPNDQTPPDIDVSGFADSDIVSRVHANLRVEGDVYYLEDVGSSNGTYINGMPLPVGNRHRLRAGDRIALGKGDKVSFIFETA